MKKVVLSLLCFLALSSISSAQISFGPKLGVGLSKFDAVKQPSGNLTFDYSYIVVPQVGVVLNAQFGDHFAVRPELLYTQRGTASKASTQIFGNTLDYKGTMRVSYIELPVNLVGSVHAGPGNIELFAGPSFGYVLGGKSHEKITGFGGDQTRDGKVIGGKEPEDYSTSTNENTYLNPFNVSLNFGVSYKLDNGLLIQAGYNLGLSNIVPHSNNSSTEDKRSDTVVKSNTITLGAAFLFGGKK